MNLRHETDTSSKYLTGLQHLRLRDVLDVARGARSPSQGPHRAEGLNPTHLHEAAALGSQQWHHDDVCLALSGGLTRRTLGVPVRMRRGSAHPPNHRWRSKPPRAARAPTNPTARSEAQRSRCSAGAADVGPLPRRDGSDGERGSGRPRDVERVGKRRATLAGRLARDQHALHLITRWIHRDCSAEPQSEDSDSTP